MLVAFEMDVHYFYIQGRSLDSTTTILVMGDHPSQHIRDG